MIRHNINLDSQSVCEFCKKWKIRELSVFGSVLRDDFHPESDVDFLADFEDTGDEFAWDLADHVEMQEELAQLVGRPVDLLTRYAVDTDPNWLLRNAILSSAESVYAQ